MAGADWAVPALAAYGALVLALESVSAVLRGLSWAARRLLRRFEAHGRG